MKLRICTKIAPRPAPAILKQFDLDLFEALNPPFPFPKVKVLRFDGCKKGDEVHLELNFLVAKLVWISEIIEESTTNQACFFVDKGIKLPFFLSYWQHRHIIESREAGFSQIIDDIEFEAPFGLSFLLWPMLYLQFGARKSVYKRVLGGFNS